MKSAVTMASAQAMRPFSTYEKRVNISRLMTILYPFSLGRHSLSELNRHQHPTAAQADFSQATSHRCAGGAPDSPSASGHLRKAVYPVKCSYAAHAWKLRALHHPSSADHSVHISTAAKPTSTSLCSDRHSCRYNSTRLDIVSDGA